MHLILVILYKLIDNEDMIPPDDPDEAGNIPFLNFERDGLTWEIVKYTVEGLPANCNSNDPSKHIAYIAVQRRRNTRRLDHINEVCINIFTCGSSFERVNRLQYSAKVIPFLAGLKS